MEQYEWIRNIRPHVWKFYDRGNEIIPETAGPALMEARIVGVEDELEDRVFRCCQKKRK
jgi:hypothetical protein